MSSITSANSVFTITVAGLFPTPVKLQGYAADRAWETSNVTYTESVMSVDGIKSSGYVFNLVEQTITLQADSASKTIFNAIVNAMKAAREILIISGNIVLPATGESFVCRRGTLKDAKPLPSSGKLLEPQTYVIEWQSIDATIS
jgi:hypothetical protein